VSGTSTGPVVSVSNGGSLHVRKGPGTEFGSAGYVSNGQAISILSEGSVWTKIKVTSSGITGYIKNNYIIGLSSASGTTSAPTPSGSYSYGAVMTKTAGGKVNLRKGAGTGYASVGKLGRSELLKIYGESGNWYNVVTGSGLSGWISKNYVALGVSGRTTANVNFRSGAGTGYSILRSLSKGTTVTVHNVTGNWAKVTAGMTNGYISMNYLTVG